MPTIHPRSRSLSALAFGLAAFLVVALSNGVARAAPTPPTNPTTLVNGAFADPSRVLGSGYRKSADVLVSGIGDTDGFHVMVARESRSYEWETLATLGTSLTGIGPLTGYTCLTGSGRYVMAVYAPAMAVNKPKLMKAGAIAAVVDLANGQVRQVTMGIQLAYFNPSCGPDDRVLLTRAIGRDEQETDLLSVDAAKATVVSTRRIHAQLTTPVPSGDVDYGIAHGKLVRINTNGSLTTLAQPAGQPFAVRATTHGAIDLVSVHGDRAVAERYMSGSLIGLGSGPRAKLRLFGLAGGRDALVGVVDGIHVSGQPDLTTVATADRVEAVSSQAHLLLNEMSARQAFHSVVNHGAPADPDYAGQLKVTVHAVHSGKTATSLVGVRRLGASDRKALAGMGPAVVGPDGVMRPNGAPSSVTDPSCAVPRNKVNRQVLQPSPNMVEWAVDQAVRGDLTVSRPANYMKTGEPAYTPQGMFPLPTNSVRVPAQIMLGIVAQESNIMQASWHAVPGDSGNPLVADYYGNGNSYLEGIDYDDSDCGYGIAQVTDGMRSTDTSRTSAQQVAIATDYAANIAAALQILIQKWNLLQQDSTYVNDGDPQYIENWFLAVWGYNSGVYLPGADGSNNDRYGVGWFNNPANPAYPANRDPFLRDSLTDASHPADWPYEEKIMGWIETPQWADWAPYPDGAYARPSFGSSQHANQLAMPDHLEFCGGQDQACYPSQPSAPCPNVDSSCWWHGNVTWADCTDDCATEVLTYSSSAGEPALARVYPTACTHLTASTGRTLRVVDDLTNSSNNLLGCSGQTEGGKFTLRLGSPTGDDWGLDASGHDTWTYSYSYYAEIDLHQVGVGYLGHMWFTHTYPAAADSNVGGTLENYHKVVGTWTPDLPVNGGYDIMVHLPSHGGWVSDAEYVIYTSASDTAGSQNCILDQDTSGVDEWVYLGTYNLHAGARVELNNISTDSSANGTTDISYDAIAFMSQSGTTTHTCGTEVN